MNLKQNTKRISKKNNEPIGMQLLRAGGIGALLGVCLLFGLAVLLSLLALKSATPNTLVFPIALIAVFACGYGGALLGAKKAASCGQNPYFGGLAVLGILFLLTVLLSLFFPSAEGRTALHRFMPTLVLLISTILGSLTAALHRPSQKRRMKKLMKR